MIIKYYCPVKILTNKDVATTLLFRFYNEFIYKVIFILQEIIKFLPDTNENRLPQQFLQLDFRVLRN